MKVYSPSQIADLLEIKPTALRRYSLLLERYGYEIERNNKRHRIYREDDIIMLQNVITGIDSGVTLEESVRNAVDFKGGSHEIHVMNTNEKAYDNDLGELKEMVQQQSELINKQNELIEGLTEQLDKQQKYMDNRLSEHDKLFMYSINEVMKSKKQIAAAEDEKSFFARMFSK